MGMTSGVGAWGSDIKSPIENVPRKTGRCLQLCRLTRTRNGNVKKKVIGESTGRGWRDRA